MSLHLSKCHTVRNRMSLLKYIQQVKKKGASGKRVKGHLNWDAMYSKANLKKTVKLFFKTNYRFMRNAPSILQYF